MDNNLEDKKVKFHYDKQFTIRFLDRSIRFLTYSLLALITLYIFSDPFFVFTCDDRPLYTFSPVQFYGRFI